MRAAGYFNFETTPLWKKLMTRMEAGQRKDEIGYFKSEAVFAERAGRYIEAAHLYEDLARKTGNMDFLDKARECRSKSRTTFLE